MIKEQVPANPKNILPFFNGKRIFITGHTGFKGSWLSFILAKCGANIRGFSLRAPTDPNLFSLTNIADDIDSIEGDIRDYDALQKSIEQFRPDIVFHLAAQPIVLDGYRDPRYTYEVNTMGTINLLEALRQSNTVRSVINVTTDKVYFNVERKDYGYIEEDTLNGHDPYSNSKSCSELVSACYRNCYFDQNGVAISTARAGNVIGGGDFASNRILPDCIRAVESSTPLIVRNPHSTRPYQHVLEPLFAYMLIAQRQWADASLSGAYNIGPDDSDCITTERLVALFKQSWGDGFSWVNVSQDPATAHEANYLKLNSTKLKSAMNWQPRWHIDEAVKRTVEWSREYIAGHDVRDIMNRQICDYLSTQSQ